ncbi:hypothetical protein Tco_0227850 [Tanacetum coccineum]
MSRLGKGWICEKIVTTPATVKAVRGVFLFGDALVTNLEEFAVGVSPEDDNDEIDAFLAIEVSSNLEEGYFDSEGDVTFLDNLLSDDASHNLTSEVISDHEPEQNESSITFSPNM